MQEIVDEEVRKAVREYLATDDAEVIDTVAHWVVCAAIVTQLAEAGIAMPPEMHATVLGAAAKMVRQ